MRGRTALEAIGSALLLLTWYLPFIYPSNLPLYRHGLPVTNLVGALLVELLGVAILVFGFLEAVRHLPVVYRRTFQVMFTGFMLWRIGDVGFKVLSGIFERPIFWWSSARKPLCLVALLLFGLLGWLRPKIAEPMTHALRVILAAFAFSALWIVPQLIHIALLRPINQSSASPNLPQAATSGPGQRIIWILFDELSYEQTFDHPAPDVAMPNFDQLRDESFSFSHLVPVGFHTDHIIPSLLLGRRINEIRVTVNSDFSYLDESQNRWLTYDPNATIFALAKRNGWTTGLDGWFMPYCQFLASTVDICSWEPSRSPIMTIEEFGASEDKSIWANVATVPTELLATSRGQRPVIENFHVREYRNTMTRAQALIDNDRVRFVFLHLPVPHPPGIYDRRRHMLRSTGTYLDNLVLADDTLGALLKEIDSTPSAARTTLIVSSDHSWRTALWKQFGDWTAEEEHASGGHFDDRPVMFVHFPGQASGSDVTPVLSEMIEHDIVADMLLGKINSPEDLSAFLSRQGH